VGIQVKRQKEKMSKGFEKKLFDVEVEMPHEDIQKLVKEYKKLKKYQKSSMCEIEKLSGKKTKVDKLVDKYNS
jgi:Zn-dependent M16 (insulinase) family peptidase